MKEKGKEKGREEEEKKMRKKRRKVWIYDFEYGNHVFVWKPCFCMKTRILYGSVCMEISGSISRV